MKPASCITLEDARYTVYDEEREEIIKYMLVHMICKGNHIKAN